VYNGELEPVWKLHYEAPPKKRQNSEFLRGFFVFGFWLLASFQFQFHFVMSDNNNPNATNQFPRKLDATEQARLQAQIGNLKKQNAQFITDEKNCNRTLEKVGEQTVENNEEGLDLSKIPALYFKGCYDGEYTVDHRTTKLLIEACHNCIFHINGPILTACTEVWKCTNVTLNSNTAVKTLQLDLTTGFALNVPSIEQFGTIVWNSAEQLKINIANAPQHNLVTGFTEMKHEFPDSNVVIDQFIIRYLNNQLTSERCIRLKNGFLSTEREAVEWDRKNELLKTRFVENFLKEGGITINKKPEKKIQPNEPCPCGSNKKYKKCCFNKKVLTGVEGDIKAEVFGKNVANSEEKKQQ
jgi:hypothetical protein